MALTKQVGLDERLRRAALTAVVDAQEEPEYVYVGRQPIVDRKGSLVAFELLFRSGLANYAEVLDDAQATAHVVARTIGEIGVSAVLDGHLGYVNINRELLMDDIVHVMAPERFVLEILETVTFDDALFKRCEQLRRQGFRFALDDVIAITPALRASLYHVDIVKVDFLACDRAGLPALIDLVKGAGKLLVAEKIETIADRDLALALGFDLFQGYYFARPTVLSSRRLPPSRHLLLKLLALLSTESEIEDLEKELKLNPNLVMHLLRLVNSSAFGLGRHISSLREAIMAIGTRQISRWAQLLLYADGSSLSLQSDPLVQLVGTRARFMELAAKWLKPGEAQLADAAFMVGIFSLVHVVLGAPIEEILERLHLNHEIHHAILSRDGLLGQLLAMVESVERGDLPELSGNLQAFTPAVVAEIGLSAAAWFSSRSL
jgi:c-di-GMP-related signal transduction protein